MKEKVFKKLVTSDEFYKFYYKSLNGILNLTNRELDVLTEISIIYNSFLIKDTYSDEELSKLAFGPASRLDIRKKLKISPFNLNNIIKTLKDKGIFIVDEQHNYKINTGLFVLAQDYKVTFTFNLV